MFLLFLTARNRQTLIIKFKNKNPKNFDSFYQIYRICFCSLTFALKQTMQEIPIPIQRGCATLDNLEVVSTEPHQEFFAVTYLLFPGQMRCYKCEPDKEHASQNVYGVFEVLCTGPTMEAVEQIIIKMFNDKRLTTKCQFVSIVPTGKHRYLHPGGDPHNAKDVYNTQTKEMVFSEHQKRLDHQKDQMKEFDDRMKDVKESAKREEEKDPNAYDMYAHLRVKESSIKSWLAEEERQIAKQKKNLLEATKKRQQLDKTHPLHKVRFNKEVNKGKAGEKEDETEEINEKEATKIPEKDKSEA